MYNPESMKAEEFIDHQEILDSLAYADAHKTDGPVIDAILEKARLRKGLSHIGRRLSCLPVSWRTGIRRSMPWPSRSRRIFMETALSFLPLCTSLITVSTGASTVLTTPRTDTSPARS